MDYTIKRLVELEKNKSSCQKRQVVCILYSFDGIVLSWGHNSCKPDGGICKRLSLIQEKTNYIESCNAIHAEIQALGKLDVEEKPYKAVLFGHDFVCQDCEKVLTERGVKEIEVFIGKNLEDISL